MDGRRSTAKRRMLLVGAIGTVLCIVGTALVFAVPIAGFALIFIGFGIFCAIPFLAFGLVGPGEERDVEPRPAAATGARHHRRGGRP